MLALCLHNNRERRQRSSSEQRLVERSSSSVSSDDGSGSESLDTSFIGSDGASADDESQPIVDKQDNNIQTSRQQANRPSQVIEEEIIRPQQQTNVTSAPKTTDKSTGRQLTKDEVTDTDDLQPQAACRPRAGEYPPTGTQEYIIKTYTCQPITRMDVREALVGTNKKFECQVIGFPPPNIRWFKDNVEITHDPRYHFSHNHEDGVVSMHIEVIKLSDAGLYQCRAENCEGYAITAAHLQVKAHRSNLSSASAHAESVKMTTVKEVGVHKAEESVVASSRRRPLIMTSSMEESDDNASVKESAPKFTERPETMVCREDETIKVSSKCQGVPKPVVTWFRDGKLLKHDNTCRLYNKKDEYYLEIPGCSILDSGEYTCTATNSQGAVFCSFNIHVEGKRISAHDLSAVEEEQSTDVQSDLDKEGHFLSMMYVVRDFYEPSKRLSFKYGEIVEVLDTQREDKWLVRKKADSLQVAYMPRSYLSQSMPDRKTLSVEDPATPTDSPKTSKQKRAGLRKSSSLRKSSEIEDSSSGEEPENDSTKESGNAVFVAVADYESSELKVVEGQFLEVLDQTNPHMWLVKTKPTKVNPSRVGWMPASYLEQKDGGGLVDRRTTREVFREDIIQITNKPAEAKVKRRYALGELIEAERDYINDLSDLIEKLEEEDPKKFKNQASVASELKDLAEFHKGLFLPELMNCMESPSEVANAFMKWQQWFDSYRDYCSHRIVTDVADSEHDDSRQHKLKYFTKPINQLKRYESLLKDFIRYTTRAGEDCSSLEKTLNMLMSVLKAIEDQQILNNIYGSPDDVKTLGRVLRHDTVTVWDNEPVDGKEKVRHMFLFPEEIVMTKPSKVGNAEEYEFKNKCLLPGVKVYNYPAKTADGDRKFELFNVSADGAVEQFVIQCKNEYSKDAWLRDISDALLSAGITDFKLTDSERSALVKQRLAQDASPPPAKKKTADQEEKSKQLEDTTSPVTETDMYMTAAETDGSTYFTAAESETDSKKAGGEKKLPEKSPQPVFTQEFEKRVVAAKGGALTLTVSVDGDPLPTVKWYKDSRELRNWKPKVSKDGHEHSLTMEGLQWDNGGRYKVKASNSQGQVECECVVKITNKASEVTAKEPEGKDAGKGKKGDEKQKGRKPKFTKQLTPEMSEDGHSIRFDCKISADPDPDVKWLHNYRALPNRGSKYSFLFVDDESHTLIVNDLSVLDAGEYAVTASNKHGEVESTVKLKAGEIRKAKSKPSPPKEQPPPAEEAKTKEQPPPAEEAKTIDSGPEPSDTKKSEEEKSQKAVEEKPSESKTLTETALTDEVPLAEVQSVARRPSVTVEMEQSKSTEVIEERVAVNEVGEETPDKPSVTDEPDTTMAIIEQTQATEEVAEVKPVSSTEVTSADEGLAEATSTGKVQMVTAQEFGVVEEIDAADDNIKQPPLKRLVSTSSVEQEEPRVNSVITEKPVDVKTDSEFSNFDKTSTLNHDADVKPKIMVKAPYGEQDVRAKDRPVIAPPSPILGKPRATRSVNNDRFVLSWEVPSYFADIEGLTYSVESCESGSDWRRLRTGIKETGVELPSSGSSIRYRIIVQNEIGEESPASVSVMVRPGKWKDESSSLLSRLEQKYLTSSDGDSISSPASSSPRQLTPTRESPEDRLSSTPIRKFPEGRLSSTPIREQRLSQGSDSSSISAIATDYPSVTSPHDRLPTHHTEALVRERRSYSSCLIPTYSSYKDHPSYQKVDGYISDTIDKYGSFSTPHASRRRYGSTDRMGVAASDPAPQLYNMSSLTATVMKVNTVTNSVKLKWPPAIRDIQSTYIVEARAPRKSYVWETHASGIFATSCMIKGLELDNYNYEFRVRTTNASGLGEPTRPTSTAGHRPKGWQERTSHSESRNHETASVFTGYTSTETDNLYWNSLNKLDLTEKKSLSQLMKAYADGYPIEPRFDMKDANMQFAVEGRRAKVMCHVYTHANSDIKWYFNDEKVMMDDRYSSNLYPSGLCVLEFSNMSWSDAGEYKIKVQNRWGVSFRNLELRVSDPPTFLETPHKHYQLNRLDALRVSCRVDGIPFPKVMFYRDWQLIPSASRCVVRREGPDAHSLTINGVLVKDSGNYQIVAENEAGRIHCTFNILVEEGTKSDGIVSVKKYLLQDYYYILEELSREETNSTHRVIEKSTGIPMYARIFTNPEPADRHYAHQQMIAMQSAAHDNVIKLINVIENTQQVVIMYEIVTTTWLDVLFSYISWTESFVAYCVKELLQIAKYLHNAHVSLANLQLENIYYDKTSSQLKIDVWNAGWLLNSASLRAKYTGSLSMYCAPEVMSGEVTLASDAWNIGVIAYILLGGVPIINKDGGISVDMTTLSGASASAKDFMSKLLQRESSERRGVDEALKHQWIKSASPDNRGTPLDIGSVKAFISKRHDSKPQQTVATDESHKHEADVIKEKSRSAEEEAWLVDWFAKYKHDHNTYLVPIRELDLPIRIREYRKHFHQEVVEEYETHWSARTLRTRELPGTSSQEVLKVKLTRDDLIALANQGLALIEQQASEASGSTPASKSDMIFRRKLETTALKVGESVHMQCEVEGDNANVNGNWYRNDDILMGDIEKNTVLASDRFTFSYAKDGKLSMVIKSAVPTDAGVYKCSLRGKSSTTVSTKARLVVGDVPDMPGRPVASKVWDTHAYLVWSEPSHDGNSPINSFKVDCKPQGSERWIVCHFTQCCSAIVEGLSPATIYRFRVSAVNAFGYSAYSWASPEIRTAREGADEIVYTPDMEQSMTLSLTPPVQGAGASPSLGSEVQIISPVHSRRSSICDNIDEVTAKSDRAEDLYKFTDEVVHTFSNGVLFRCRRKDTKHSYVASIRGHTPATETELDILKSLHHNHIQRLYDLYEQPTQFTLIFQNLSAENILQRLARKATYTERFVADAMIQLSNAVEYLHHHDIIHGVVHPCNMVMSTLHGERVVLTNFSQARRADSGAALSSIYTEFLAPEAVMNEGINKNVDIWGLGLSALILLSGKSPFHGETDEETISRIQYLRFRISSVHPNSSQNAHRFIYTCLKRVPGNRPEASEVVNHSWLDVGFNLHQKSDEIIFPAVEFSDLVSRLEAFKRATLKVESVVW